VFSKLTLPSQGDGSTIEGAVGCMENLSAALHAHIAISDDSKHELWIKTISIMQDKILLNPSCNSFTGTSSLVKNAVLTHTF
jgi:hypothetical protein